jgi:hypothetical protein
MGLLHHSENALLGLFRNSSTFQGARSVEIAYQGPVSLTKDQEDMHFSYIHLYGPSPLIGALNFLGAFSI